MRKLLALIFLCMPNTFTEAHPVSYKGAIGVMTWSQPWLSDYWVTYSFEPNLAVAVRTMRMNMNDGKLNVYLPQLDYLVKRWNEKNLQANIYTYAGGGLASRDDGKNGNAGIAGIEADAETRSLFAEIKGEWMRPSFGSKFDHYELRIGVAPYEAEFNEIASWLMIQFQHHSQLIRQNAITPLGRFFYRNVLFEVGMSLDGDSMVNLMFHF
jgi:hypothetical protein